MATWGEFAAATPEMAEVGRTMLYRFGPGLGYLATVARDGGPRIHPVCPTITDGGLYLFVVPSPKRADLRANGRFALHSFPLEDADDEFFVAGHAVAVDDPDHRARIAAVVGEERSGPSAHEQLFVLDIERALLAVYKPRGAGNTWPPAYTHWRAPAR